MQCKVCQKVTMADGSQVWVCKECGEEHQPGEGVALDQATQAEVSAAASQVTPPTSAAPAAPAMPGAPTDVPEGSPSDQTSS